MPVQRQVGNQLFELLVLVPELAQLPDLGCPETAKLLLPAVERLLNIAIYTNSDLPVS